MSIIYDYAGKLRQIILIANRRAGILDLLFPDRASLQSASENVVRANLSVHNMLGKLYLQFVQLFYYYY